MYNGTQFVSKFLDPLCVFLRAKHITTTAYLAATNGLAERSNKTNIGETRQYVAEHKKAWDM